jgi:hypothetical protein
MKKIKLLIGIIIGLTILSCSSDDNDIINEPDLTVKKLIKITEEGTYGIYERDFIYEMNNVVKIESSFTEFGQTSSELQNTVFTYENDLIVSAIDYQNGTSYRTYEFNYTNGKLTERRVFNSSGTEIEKLEFNYNSNNEVNSYNYYIEGDLQQVQNFTYTNQNITIAEDIDYSEIQYDTNPTPSNNFTDSNKIIFGAEFLLMSLCQNNETNRTTTYNYLQPSETIRNFETSITYDSDNYPIKKILVQTDTNGNVINTRTTDFDYE